MIEVGRPVFDNFDGHNFLRLEVLAFDDLAKCALTKDIQNQVTISVERRAIRFVRDVVFERHRYYTLMPIILVAEDVIDV